jgi:uncharacterized membrane protein YqhA
MFIPYDFELQNLIKGVLLVDLLGLILRWKTMDHAAHLAGAVVGLLYVSSGRSVLWNNAKLLEMRKSGRNREAETRLKYRLLTKNI